MCRSGDYRLANKANAVWATDEPERGGQRRGRSLARGTQGSARWRGLCPGLVAFLFIFDRGEYFARQIEGGETAEQCCYTSGRMQFAQRCPAAIAALA